MSYGTADGIATVLGDSHTVIVGSASGAATVTAVGEHVGLGVGSSAGVATCSGVSSVPAHQVTSIANAVANFEWHHKVTATSAAVATSIVSGLETQTEVSQAEATATYQAVIVMTLVGQAAAMSPATLHYLSTLTSSADATSPVDGTALATNGLVSTAVATATLSGVGRKSATAVAVANATDNLALSATESVVSTADTASNLVGIRTAVNTETSTAAASSTTTEGGHSIVTLKSSAVGSAVVSYRLQAHQILLSSANATAYIVLPYGPRIAFWSNAVSTAAATWDGAPFETVIASDDVMYAAGADGIYRITKGADDNGSPIAAEMLWDLLDFGDPKKHRLGNVVIGAISAGPLNVRVINKQGRFDYPTHLPTTTKATNLRAKLGKGLSARYNRLGLTNPGGRDFKFNTAAVEVVSLSRRIGGT